MRRRGTRSIVLIALGLLVLALVSACAPPPPPPPSSPAAAEMLDRHNYVRGLNGIGAYSVDGGMQANAQFHADRLAANGAGCSSLWHSPELGSWYSGFAAGENVACVSGCPASAQPAFDMWLASPGHAANVMNPGYSRIGIATACNGNVQMVVAQYRSG